MSESTPDPILEILIAEDESITRLRLKNALESMGHRVRAYPNGREAWEAFDRSPTRVIVSDWQMPEMDGPELCRRVRARSKTEYTYFILVTGMETQESDYDIASDAGADDFVSKPLTNENLWRRLRVARRILGYTTEIRQLRDLIPMCAYCRQIREDDDYWSNLEEYVQSHTKSRFSHGICPQCYAKVMRDFELERAALQVGNASPSTQA
jgi:CheY-like chemotaxis protein